MRVFDFTLLSGYEFSGVDVAQGFRARLFAKNNVNAKFIFTELPTIRDMELYGSQKIKRGQIMSAHLFMTGRLDMSLSVKKKALLENEKENYEYDNIDEDGKVIRLYNSGEKSVEILCNEDGFVINESLFKNGKKYLVNYYTDSLSYTELYNWDNDSNDGLNPERRIFWNKQGQMVYEQCIYKDNVEYLFKNGEVIDNVEFLERFVKALNLCENDICIMDRAGYLDYIQPLFENKGKSKLIAVLHSDHFYKIYEDESSLYMNYEYYYWFKYSEAKDDYMRGHSYRVAEYSALIAKQLGWSEHDVENLRNAAYLHDIGKIGVPDTILNKPTRLTDEEFAAIKSHTVMGADILKDITLLDHLVDIARNHHERYDGKGYPDGLVGEEIPLSARIVCVADSYDAMRSRRIYRNALPDEEIRRELLDNCSTQFDPQISRMFVDMLDKGMVVIDEDNPAAQGYRDNAAIESVADKFISEVMKTMSSQEKADSVDYLTGLYMRSRGQQVIAALMQDNDGCLAFIDMDNLKKVNDVHGHKAGDRALKLIGNLLAKETENETFAACRIGGDEFLIFMPYSDRASVESVIKRIFEGFESAREADCEIKEAALSAGLCMTTKGAMFESDYTKADKALYYVKQNCKGSYFFYEQLLADNKENTNLSADLRNVAKLLKESGSYTGALDLNYREFARIYEFVNNVGDRHNHNCYLVMVTMNTLPEQLADIEEIEKALDCMEQSIRSKIRKVDVCTRYSSMQYLIILFEPQENQIPNVMERIFMHYYKLCDREDFKPQYEYIKMTEVK